MAEEAQRVVGSREKRLGRAAQVLIPPGLARDVLRYEVGLNPGCRSFDEPGFPWPVEITDGSGELGLKAVEYLMHHGPAETDLVHMRYRVQVDRAFCCRALAIPIAVRIHGNRVAVDTLPLQLLPVLEDLHRNGQRVMDPRADLLRRGVLRRQVLRRAGLRAPALRRIGDL